MASWHDIWLRKLQEHSILDAADIGAIRRLPDRQRAIGPGEDLVRQGDKPNVSAIVLSGMLARYHTLSAGRRQFLSLHIAGDMPDAQSLFIEVMDHAVCAIDDAMVALVPHNALLAVLRERPAVAFAIWRETLIDAAIFRQAITNNSARALQTRLAHFLCEQYYRARASGLARSGSCKLPLTQTQIGETIGASLPSVARALKTLRKKRAMDLRAGELHIYNWNQMVELGGFNPAYLHLRKAVRV